MGLVSHIGFTRRGRPPRHRKRLSSVDVGGDRTVVAVSSLGLVWVEALAIRVPSRDGRTI